MFGIHKNAVLRWFKEGLQPDKSGRPYLIQGNELIGFLVNRQQSKKRPCTLTEFFCFRCRVPRQGRDKMVDIIIESPTRFRIKAACVACGTRMSKVQAAGNLKKIQDIFHVQKLERRHLIECAEPSVNCDMEPKI